MKTMVIEPTTPSLLPDYFPDPVATYPKLRFMGSKHKLLPWIHEELSPLAFDSALDAFSGSGCVSYLFKTMGKAVTSNDFLNFTSTLSTALVENPFDQISSEDLALLLRPSKGHPCFIQETFSGVFFRDEDLEFLDSVWANLREARRPYLRALTLSALVRACVKRQPRGVFTVSGNLDHYNDGRRDLRLSIREHFIEQVPRFNQAVFDNHQVNRAFRGNAADLDIPHVDLVYMDPPYVPQSDDNCYVKRYHFLEGLSCYWEGLEIMAETKVKKIAKPFSPFSYRKTAIEAFDQMFKKFKESILVLSYSSNGFPDLDELLRLMKQYKRDVMVHTKAHRYHFGTHAAVERSMVDEYLIVGI